ncbi:MAG TPA: type II toxin-antitoxin system RelE/ParE family toxin [Chromatiales bacterium]|nr:type II toxin-antitoxin system RelE/ParE family toxin [Chromatiales bacterium]
MQGRAFRTRPFTRWMRRAGVTDGDLARAVGEMARGLVDADLGGGLLKKRIPLPGRGRRGGARVIVAARRNQRWFFLYGFAKNERETLTPAELRALRELGKEFLRLDERGLSRALRAGALAEVCGDETQEQAP